MTIDKTPPEFEKAVNRSLIISDVRNSLKTNDDQIVYSIKFQPLKPFKTQAFILITKNNGSTWRFNVYITSNI